MQNVEMNTKLSTRKKRESLLLITVRRLAKNKMAMTGLIIYNYDCRFFISPILAPYPYEQVDLYNTLVRPAGASVRYR